MRTVQHFTNQTLENMIGFNNKTKDALIYRGFMFCYLFFIYLFFYYYYYYFLTLKVLITTAEDEILFSFFSEKIRLAKS